MKLNPYIFFLIIGSILFCIPAQIQLPFKVLCLFLFNILIINNCRIKLSLILILIGLLGFCIYKIKNETFDTSLFIVGLSIIPVYYFYELKINFSARQLRNIRKILYIWLLFLIIQLTIFRYNGRPNLSYEINQSASYLFLFYILCRILKLKTGIFFVICISFLMLSRLLILCIILYELNNILIPKYKVLFTKFSYTNIVLIAFVIISIFSIWYFLNMAENIVEGSDGASRLSNINDGSNYLRFKINTNIIFDLIDGENKKFLLFSGYGDLGVNPTYKSHYILMPHNEIIKSIAQFGLCFTLLCLFIARKAYNNLININSLPIFIAIVAYTLILWVRFTVVPSLEMIFILFIITLNNLSYAIKYTY